MRIGILALQGAFAEHAAVLDRLGVEHFEIRQCRDLESGLDGLILPGGESTAMRKLLCDLNLFGPLRERIHSGLPVFGTCAGLILLAKQVEGGVPCFASMDICARRDAYGRQLGSFHTEEPFDGIGRIPMTFIRAPYITSTGADACVLSSVGGRIVAALQGRQLVTAFHPELDENLSVHRFWLKLFLKK